MTEEDNGSDEFLADRYRFAKVGIPVPGFDIYDTWQEAQFPPPIMAHCSNISDARRICEALNGY